MEASESMSQKRPTISTLLTDDLLEQSGVVANCRMNRERTLTGGNGYTKELGFNPFELLREKSRSADGARWLDLCCGSGQALIEAARTVQAEGLPVEIVGVDLVEMFSRHEPELNCLRLIVASLTTWHPDQQFDVITCVHGLHYVGDKLGLVTRIASWLTKDGYFAGSFSLENVKFQNGGPTARVLIPELRKNGLNFDTRRRRLICEGHRRIDLPFRYLGADDQPGPNYTGQAAVDSDYCSND